MKLLLDTHALLWFIEGNSLLSNTAKQLIEELDNEIFVSSVSLFEIAIKEKIGKIKLHKPLNEIFKDIEFADIKILSINNLYLLQYQIISFPDDHRDPFDRLIIATAIAESAGIISTDQKFIHYSDIVNVIW